MELKRVLAKDSRTAKDQVCAEFGEDALIVSNQRINGKTELIVAVDITEERVEPALPTLGEKNQVSRPSASGFGKMLDTSAGLGNSAFNDKSPSKSQEYYKSDD